MREVDIQLLLKFCMKLPLLHEELIRAGLYKTGQKMKMAVDEIGFEVADIIEKNSKEPPCEK